ncbi:MAG: hypothetical protein FWF60_05110 [Oscillospiraceae bacterium]|nr:hypothetical protein [Oscillospiraceae bacterium]
MKISYYDPKKRASNAIDNVYLHLKKNEIIELIGALENLLGESNSIDCGEFVINPGDHYHVNDADYSHEITVCIEES